MIQRRFTHGPFSKQIAVICGPKNDFTGNFRQFLTSNSDLVHLHLKLFFNPEEQGQIKMLIPSELLPRTTLIAHPLAPKETYSALVFSTAKTENLTITSDTSTVSIHCDGQTELYATNLHNIDLFNEIQAILKANKFSFENVVRTWFFIPNLLEHYARFNKMRGKFFADHQIYQYMPASTGIEGYGTSEKITADFIATTGQRIPIYHSSLQGDARVYKSLFARALMHQYKDDSVLYISGTASIATSGETIHQDDIAGQIAHTMNCVEALMQQEQFDAQDYAYSIAYCKNEKVYQSWLENNHPFKKGINTIADVCRDDLLFEIEVMLVRNR